MSATSGLLTPLPRASSPKVGGLGVGLVWAWATHRHHDSAASLLQPHCCYHLVAATFRLPPVCPALAGLLAALLGGDPESAQHAIQQLAPVAIAALQGYAWKLPQALEGLAAWNTALSSKRRLKTADGTAEVAVGLQGGVLPPA